MSRERFSSGSRFEELARYSRAVRDGDWLFMSATVGLDPDTGELPESAEAQARNAFRVIEATLADARMALDDVVRCTVFLTDATHLDALVTVLAEKFERVRPANTTVLCQLPVPGAKVEIEVTALRRS